MFPDLFPLFYPSGLILWTVLGFCLTRTIYESKQRTRAKRRRAIHPELMDEKGELIDEDLFAVRFGILGGSDDCPDHQSFGKVPFALYRTRLKQKSRS